MDIKQDMGLNKYIDMGLNVEKDLDQYMGSNEQFDIKKYNGELWKDL